MAITISWIIKWIIMYATNVRNLKRNPSKALRHAEEEPVLIMKGNQPYALLIHLNQSIKRTTKSIITVSFIWVFVRLKGINYGKNNS